MSARRFFAKKVVASDMQLATTWRTVRDFIAVAVAPLGERRNSPQGCFSVVRSPRSRWRTPAHGSSPFSAKKHARESGRAFLAHLKGLEPLAHCLEGSCSIHLSYKCIFLKT